LWLVLVSVDLQISYMLLQSHSYHYQTWVY